MMLGFLVLKRRGLRELLSQVPLMPFYWLLISGAAYRAAWQFATNRFSWEKTAHGLSHGTTRAARLRLTRWETAIDPRPATRWRALKTGRARGQ